MTHAKMPLFYQSPKVLQPAAHGGRSLAAQGNYRFAAHTNAVPLAAEEIATAGRHFPVVFSEGDTPHPVAVLGLRGQQNLYVNEAGQWREGVYVPAYIRRYPFIFHEDATGNELTLCIDEASELLVEGRHNPLFDAQGEPSALTRNALAFCRDYQAGHHLAAAFTRALIDANLLVERRADVTLNDGQRLSLSGFKVIDQGRFAKLPDNTFVQWRHHGWLPLVYAHFFSVGTWSSLIDRTI